MSIKKFTADVNKTITIKGNVFTLTVPADLPEDVNFYLNEVKIEAGQTVELTENSTIGISVEDKTVTLLPTFINMNSIKINGTELENGKAITLDSGSNTLTAEGATSIPSVQINGDGVVGMSVNGVDVPPDNLPYTFQPVGGITNSVFVNGAEQQSRQVTIAGTDIESCTVNGQPVNLPYKFTPAEDTTVAVSGEIYQVDLASVGGTVVRQDGIVIADGNAETHKIIDIDHDTYLTLDATHDVIIDGSNVKEVTVNGVTAPVDELPYTIRNKAMKANVKVVGYEPSEVHVVGNYMDTVTVDGEIIPIGEAGTVDFELTTREENHFINIIGSQPREYRLTVNDGGTTEVKVDGVIIPDGGYVDIAKDVKIDSVSLPIPVHFEVAEDAYLEINGRDYTGRDTTFNVTSATEVDITTDTCVLTVDYGDDSYSYTVPRNVVSITAPHRDGWVFDCWSSDNVGIKNPKQVKTTIDLRGKTNAHIVAHYQQYYTINKPNNWN